VIFAIHFIIHWKCEIDMIVYHRIIDHVIHSQIFILLWLLFDVMLCCRLESVYKSKAKEKSEGDAASV
jgi:hypothetical protein